MQTHIIEAQEMIDHAATKWCSRGKHHLPLDQFADHSYTRDGKQPWCKGCRREYDKGRKLALKNSREVEL